MNMETKYYFAPLEGITGYVFRQAHHEVFGNAVDKYFTPFLATSHTMHFKGREYADVMPEHNQGMPVVPQLLSNKPDEFLAAAKYLADLGYREVNLNLGCPMPTVASKGRGSGFLRDPEGLDAFLEAVFEKLDQITVEEDGTRHPLAFSIKTRLGVEDVSEAQRLFQVFEKYPFSEVIVHARTKAQRYAGHPDTEAFMAAVKHLRVPVCYNGDIYSLADAEKAQNEMGMDRIMLGRGLLRNPALVREIKTGQAMTMQDLRRFHSVLYDNYREVFERGGDKITIGKMKEIWAYWGQMLDDDGKYLKNVHKSKNRVEYEAAARMIFANCGLTKKACNGI